MSSGLPVLSVVIPCLNVAATLGPQLDALSAQDADFEWEVVIADNGSTDQTVPLATSYTDRLQIAIVHEAMRGRQFACNTGARSANGKYLVFVDGDDVVQPGFLKAMAEGLACHEMAAGRFDNGQFADAGALQHGPTISDAIMSGYGFLPFASGGCTGIHADVFAQVGGFDADSNYCEDTALSWRVQLAGYQLGAVPGAVVAVRQRSTFASMFRQHRNFGKARVWLYRTFRDKGMPRRSGREISSDWTQIIRAVPHLRDVDVRTRWTRRLGRNVGFIVGSVTMRCRYL